MQELEPGALATDAITVRHLTADDLAAIIQIDEKAIGRARKEYYRAKVRRVLEDGKMMTSLVAEEDGSVVGFVLAALHYGEFGQVEATAVIDSIGVAPAFRGKGVGEALMRQLEMNLRALRVQRLETQVPWEQRDLLNFLASRGFAPAAIFCLELDLSGSVGRAAN